MDLYRSKHSDKPTNRNSSSNDNTQSLVTSFTSENSGLNIAMQWEVDIWGKLLNARRAAAYGSNTWL